MTVQVNKTVEVLKEFPDPKDIITVDIETNGLLLSDVTKFHAICLHLDGQTLRYSTLPADVNRGHSVEQGIKMLKIFMEYGKTPVFHNGAGYDIAVIHQFFPESEEWLRIDNTLDSFLFSCIAWPDRVQGHSLESYGEDTGEVKVQNKDWDVVTENVVKRCMSDTIITKKVYELLYQRADIKDHLEMLFVPLTLESEVSHIHQKQMNHGVMYDLGTALEHWAFLNNEIDTLEDEILLGAPWKTLIPNIPLKDQADERYLAEKGIANRIVTVKPKKKNGDYKVAVLKEWGPDVMQVQGEYCRVECKPMNLGNSQEVKDYLTSLGWKPTEYNYAFENGRKVRKSPKLTEDSYASLPTGMGQKIAKYRTYLHRSRSILNQPKTGGQKGAISTIRKDGRISAEAMTCGTPTARYRHMRTICNIPRPSSLFGGEIRETFTVADGHLLIGIDLAGIEARMLAHFLKPYPGSGPIIDAILADKGSGVDDFHTRNAKMWGVSRDTAKSGLYALMYGCYPKKLAETLGYHESKGEELHDDFWKFNAPIKMLVDDLERSFDVNGGWVTGLDGRPLYVREKRKLLNTLLQHAATMVFKKWMVLCDEQLELWKSDWRVYGIHQVIAYHDELQFEYYHDDVGLAKAAAARLCTLALEAGKFYNVAVDTPAEAMIGKNWRECH